MKARIPGLKGPSLESCHMVNQNTNNHFKGVYSEGV